MSYELIVKPLAEADIADAYRWYEDQRAGLGLRFMSAVDHCLQQVQQLPLASPTVFKEARRAHVKKFPYAVYYVVEGNAIIVLAVVHGKRHPSRWQSRLP